jgi:hypothetical protein
MISPNSWRARGTRASAVRCGGRQTTLPKDGERREEVGAGGVGEAEEPWRVGSDARAMEAGVGKGAHVVESGWRRRGMREMGKGSKTERWAATVLMGCLREQGFIFNVNGLGKIAAGNN